MATYHGLIKVTCLVCDYETEDIPTIERLNDMGDVCPDCENEFFRWLNDDGSIVVSLTVNGQYSNLVMENK
jgi:hypothetical protein